MDAKKKREGRTPPAKKEELNQGLEAVLSSVVVTNGLREIGNIKAVVNLFERLTRSEPWKSDLTLLDLAEVLHQAMLTVSDDVRGKSGSLTSILTAEAYGALRSHVRDALLSFPRHYEMWVELPAMPLLGEEIELTRAISLVEEDRSKIMAGSMRPATPGRTVFARTWCSGYGSYRADTTAVQHGISALKQLFRGLDLLDMTETSVRGLVLATAMGQPEIVLRETSRLGQRFTLSLPRSVDRHRQKVTWKKSLLDGLKTTKQKAQAVSAAAKSLTTVLNCPDDHADAMRIKTALEWGFDAAQHENQTLEMLQACIGLEALLGDDAQDEPLVKRLADRCAYLLGSGSEDRDSIRKTFTSVYKLRSSLVHGRKAKLKREDTEELEKARSLLKDVTKEEIRHLIIALDGKD